MSDDKEAKAKAEADAKAKAEAEAKQREADEKAAKEKADKEAKAKAEADAKAPRALFHVVGPGSVQFKGERYRAHAKLQLTKAEAAELGDTVKAGAPPAPPEDINKRKSGDYVVAGPGCVWFEGRAREAGFTLKLSAEEAKRLGDAVKPAEAE